MCVGGGGEGVRERVCGGGGYNVHVNLNHSPEM